MGGVEECKFNEYNEDRWFKCEESMQWNVFKMEWITRKKNFKMQFKFIGTFRNE